MAVIPSLILFLLNDYREGLSGPQLTSARLGNFALSFPAGPFRGQHLAEELKR